MIKINPELFDSAYKALSHIKNTKIRREQAESIAHDELIRKIKDGNSKMIQWFLVTHRPKEYKEL